MPKVDFREEVANVALAELLARNNIRLARHPLVIGATRQRSFQLLELGSLHMKTCQGIGEKAIL